MGSKTDLRQFETNMNKVDFLQRKTLHAQLFALQTGLFYAEEET